nr:type III-A CRISPR-associated RAMP protein Csm4 [uncultured Desulfobulbus sp.]
MRIAYHLFFYQPVHFGLEGIGQENIEQTVRSDTLWGAIIQKWILLYADDPSELCRNMPFTLSSCFPLVSGQRYFPVPLGALDRLMDLAAMGKIAAGRITVKDIKKIRYIAESLLADILDGQPIEDKISADNVLPRIKEGQQQPDEKDIFTRQEQRPRLRTNQLAGGVDAEGFFYCTDQFFARESGLFFLAEFTERQTQHKFEAALRLLGDSGLGADRSVGRGCFTFSRESVHFPQTKNRGRQLLLSLYHPLPEEVNRGVMAKGASAYSLIRRYGHGGSTLVSRFRRADCWMLSEGSILPFAPVGHSPVVLKADAQIPHDIYRNGRAFCLAMGGV